MIGKLTSEQERAVQQYNASVRMGKILQKIANGDFRLDESGCLIVKFRFVFGNVHSADLHDQMIGTGYRIQYIKTPLFGGVEYTLAKE